METLQTEFTSTESVWNDEHDISVDMLKQFLMHEITEAHRFGLGDFQPNNRNARSDFRIYPQYCTFFSTFLVQKRQSALGDNMQDCESSSARFRPLP